MTNLPSWLTSLSVGGLAIWGLIEIVKTLIRTFANRGVVRVNAADKLSDSALDLVRQAGDDAKAARDEARAARQDAAESRREASEARREADASRRAAEAIQRDFSRIKSAIMSPYATLDQLRAMVSDPPSSNGTSYTPARP